MDKCIVIQTQQTGDAVLCITHRGFADQAELVMCVIPREEIQRSLPAPLFGPFADHAIQRVVLPEVEDNVHLLLAQMNQVIIFISTCPPPHCPGDRIQQR